MDEMKVYIVNIGSYNEGNTKGSWFVLPVTYEDLKEKIGLNEKYEEYAIHDYELPFEVSEHTSIDELNSYYEMLLEMDDDIISNLEIILKAWFSDIEELYDQKDNIKFHTGMASVEDYVFEYIEDLGVLNSLPEKLRYYFDYAALARDFEIEGKFLESSSGLIEYLPD